jgi:putative hydrolase of the HAD superfamily
MEPSTMKLRAVIFDVYQTLLTVGPPPVDADAQWRGLCQRKLGIAKPVPRARFSAICKTIVDRHHATARARGIAWPEVCWPAVIGEAIPAFKRLCRSDQAEFLYRLALTSHTLHISKQTAEMLRWLRRFPLVLGIASNAQGYTLQELETELAPHKLALDLFDPQLCIWSFQLGFSKPDPHFFQILGARLGERGIQAGEILMVGDRSDNDMAPAKSQGWHTWQVLAGVTEENKWAGLRELLQPSSPTKLKSRSAARR